MIPTIGHIHEIPATPPLLRRLLALWFRLTRRPTVESIRWDPKWGRGGNLTITLRIQDQLYDFYGFGMCWKYHGKYVGRSPAFFLEHTHFNAPRNPDGSIHTWPDSSLSPKHAHGPMLQGHQQSSNNTKPQAPT